DYYPLNWSFWWVEWRFWGENAAGYHVVNVLLHAANVILVWMILRQLGIRCAWPVALVFAVHPVNTEAVAWVTQQKTTLSMLLFCAAILLYMRFDVKRRLRWYWSSMVAFLLALLSKSAVAMLPVVLLGCIWWRHGRVGKRDILHSVPFFAQSVVLG